ncbi:4-carboxymuconolactone decarboxylase [Hymenobacter gelipurpurascens]|uniref:4-carboxymuconolactone decarboxylase n=1 Tax=Hymenobacter gelipurpurascens TaxID=89968 RepID=A0A212TGT3_9BACT|nr:carboxymuconolactone decarboxylase family protein [Hymenobacter gelipurpurascens]SNC65213.1 4-carboxymuconolactone decarboxylase [Hymenobacter gelipurpurascens]
MTSINPKGDQQPDTYFTGTVFANLVVTPADNLSSVIGKMTFEPRARTNWHTHSVGQVLIVTQGVGYYQETGQPAVVIREGDVVKIAPGMLHWHGASHHSSLTHTAIVPSAQPDGTTWLQPVTEEEYDAAVPATDSIPAPVHLTEAAHRNHEALWPEYKSRAKATDPELIEVFDNFAFDEVISHDELPVKTRVMVILASTIGSQALSEYKMTMDAALNVGVTPVEIKEILYQSVPYVGISKVLDFIYATNQKFTQRGINLPLAGRQSTTTRETRYDAGFAVQKQIVGARLDELYAQSPEDLLHIQRYLSANCFGDFYTRQGLDLKMRELVTLSYLVALGGTDAQIKGHVTGNVNVGNDRQTLINVLTQLLPYVGYPRTLNAIACLNGILPA